MQRSASWLLAKGLDKRLGFEVEDEETKRVSGTLRTEGMNEGARLPFLALRELYIYLERAKRIDPGWSHPDVKNCESCWLCTARRRKMWWVCSLLALRDGLG